MRTWWHPNSKAAMDNMHQPIGYQSPAGGPIFPARIVRPTSCNHSFQPQAAGQLLQGPMV